MGRGFEMASLVLCFLLFHFVTGNENYYRGDSILHHINSGMKIAQEFLGSESIALKVADFVVRAFQPVPVKRKPSVSYLDQSTGNDDSEENRLNYNTNEVPPSLSPLRHLVRLLGLQPRQISAVAVNALIFLAQMITSFLAGPRNLNRQYRSEDLTKWILNKNSQRLQDLIATAKNESLPEHIEDLIEQESEEETNCIRLLVCKITPYINKMQKAVFSGEDEELDKDMKGASFMYRHLPAGEEIKSRSKFCESKYKDCNLYE